VYDEIFTSVAVDYILEWKVLPGIRTDTTNKIIIIVVFVILFEVGDGIGSFD
tara:strand:+ start:226 stop:381 length:156 start_codon:yes stop_codon:yes gene_type:complete